jgi:hypothetical protein
MHALLSMIDMHTFSKPIENAARSITIQTITGIVLVPVRLSSSTQTGCSLVTENPYGGGRHAETSLNSHDQPALSADGHQLPP